MRKGPGIKRNSEEYKTSQYTLDVAIHRFLRLVLMENIRYNFLINSFYIMQMLSTITAVDDLNYPEKTETYYIVNAPYVFSACWKVSGHT